MTEVHRLLSFAKHISPSTSRQSAPGASDWQLHFGQVSPDTLPELQPTHRTAVETAATLASRSRLLHALDRHDGCLLLRNTGIDSAKAMQRVLGSLIAPMNYVGGTNSRNTLSGDVLDAGTEPPHLHVAEHCEMAYLDRMPSIVAFSCLKPASGGGGETTVLSCADMEQALPPTFVEKLKSLGIQHTLMYGEGGVRTWQDTFKTQSRADVEEYTRQRGWSCRWTDNGGVGVSFTRASFIEHPRRPLSLAAALCNTDLSASFYRDWEPHGQLDFYRQPYSFKWGDGTAFTDEELAAWGCAKDKGLRRCQWLPGDLMILDNIRVMHGRLPYSGHREMAVMLGDPHVRQDPQRGRDSKGTWVDTLNAS